MLELTGITKSFGGLTALKDVSLQVGAGQIVGLIGPNGAGKTTLFGVASGFIAPDEGSITVDGRPMRGSRPDQLSAAGVTRTFQIPQVFGSLSVRDNVLTGALRWTSKVADARAAAEDSMERLGMQRLADRLAESLSVLEKKQLEIARALATRPKVLLLDEVMAGLRVAELRQLVEMVREIHAETKVSVVIVEHVIEAVWALADWVAVLDQGRLIATGTPAEIRNSPAVINAYLGTADDE